MAKYKVSDHARIRYITRICGVPMKEIDRAVLKEENHELVIQGRTVVTVVKKKKRDRDNIKR